MKTDAQLRKAARAAGILTEWQDVHGRTRAVGHETLRSLLEILGSETKSAEVPLITAEAGAAYAVPGLAAKARAPREPGYYPVTKGKRHFTLAVAPARQPGRAAARGWGLSVQLYALYRQGDGGIGSYGALRDFLRSSAEAGASAVAVSPLHAQFSADPWRFSPYSPSSRLWMNALHIEVGEAAALLALKPPKLAPRQGAGGDALIAWPEASRARLKALRTLFDAAHKQGCFDGGHPAARSLAAFRRAGAASLLAHATFEALHAHFFGRDRNLWSWSSWPGEYRDPNGAAVRRFARANRESVEFHLFLQWLAARQFKSAAEAARDGRMAQGIIKDIAVGADGGGSEAWSNQGRMLTGAAIGAPPDAFNTLGQNWGVTTFSPNALVATGYTAFIQLLRSALADAGGIRIDHVLGLRRLWVVPNGADARDGAYLRYPLTDLLRLTALEAHRAGAVVLGEDLGTVPEGFREELDGFSIKGMQVLWFERQGQAFLPPRKWRRRAVGMTTTHDLPTVAGWWLGKDIAWRRKLKLFAARDGAAKAAAERKRDRAQLWDAFLRAGAAAGRQPGTHDVTKVLAGAIDYLGSTACDLVLLPLEDALGRKEQPNLPGTIAEHPNWRRRILVEAGAICRQKQVAARLRRLAASRSKPGRAQP
ncbi:4-alpha-glucanotransferase [Dongia sp.]|uniref:4-alpha-glucanotransferase n=1 Tax=Dongia sp. TaxID=1977262 RepID=UPI003750EBBE